MFFRLIRLSVLLSLSELKEKSLIRNDPDKSEFTRMSLFLKSVQKRRRGKCSKFKVSPMHNMPTIDRDRSICGAEFRRRLFQWQLEKCFRRSAKARIDSRSRKNELRSCPTAKQQFLSAMKTSRHDFASVLSGTHGI